MGGSCHLSLGQVVISVGVKGAVIWRWLCSLISERWLHFSHLLMAAIQHSFSTATSSWLNLLPSAAVLMCRASFSRSSLCL